MLFKRNSRSTWIVLVAATLLLGTTIYAQQRSAPKSSDEITARLVCNLIDRFHVSRHTVNDEVSSAMLDNYLKELDPQKLAFLQSDVDALSKDRYQLDNYLHDGKVDLAYTIYDLYLQRLEQHLKYADKWIDAEQDFTIDESIPIDPKSLKWATSEEEINERWRKLIKYDLLSNKLDDVAMDEARTRLHKKYRNKLVMERQTEKSEKLEKYLTALARAFDPHSDFMSPESQQDFQISMSLSLEGIGAALRSEDGFTVVADIVPGGAASKDGRLKVKDTILAVAQETGEFVDVVDMKLNRVVRLIRGDKGTIVRLKVKTATEQDTRVYDLTRQKIELKSAEVKGEIIDTADRVQGTNLRIGVVHIPSFYRDFAGAQSGVENYKSTSRDVAAVLRDFNRKGVDAVIVDLRSNGGGALNEAIEVSGLFIDNGPVVQVKEPEGSIRPYNDDDPGVGWSGPLVVICNRLSASASEIFAGAIKDYHRGIVVGDLQTHGKGTVQNVLQVSNKFFQLFTDPNELSGALKLTIQQFYRVNGDSTQNRGVHSDIVLPSLIDHMDLGESFLDNALEFDRIEAARFSPAGFVNGDIVSALAKLSQERVTTNEEFQKLQKDIQEYLVRKSQKALSLNEGVRRAELAKFKAEEKLDELNPEDGSSDKPIFPKDFYNDEILAITADYVALLRGVNTAAH